MIHLSTRLCTVWVAVAAFPLVGATQQRPPIIDMHLHAYGASQWPGRPPNPATGQSAPPLPSIDSLRALYRAGKLRAMGEITAQYEGLSPSDSSLDPYFALAEELDIPVGIHTGTSFPGMPYSGKPGFRVALGNPLLLEELLVRHPRLRVYIMHGGFPWQRGAVALLHMYPQVYMDIAVIDWIGGQAMVPRFHQFLRDMFAEGLGQRVMFGTDQMRWPEAIELAIQAVESADFLTARQKRDILYNNAARFLKLSEAEIARHHGR
jgi:predicted TIM-barrel fold metal-dependent hydrolase